MAATIEKRDPYTGGHQARVAVLAVAIATDLGLTASEVHTIDLGARIHDVGKIFVPAEILARTGSLGPEEINLIHTHSRAGYEILSTADLPSPLCDLVHQHHERLDGSGYPRGLKGDEIRMEARNVAVADVVEAMTSNRPYRLARGVEFAIDEIQTNRGTLYDPDVVDACIQQFSTEHFSFE